MEIREVGVVYLLSSGTVSNYLIEEARDRYKLSVVDSIRLSKFVMLYFMEEYRLRKLLGGKGLQELFINDNVSLRYDDPWSAFDLGVKGKNIGSKYVVDLPGFIMVRLDEMVVEVFRYLQLVKSQYGLRILVDFYELYLNFGNFRHGYKFIAKKLKNTYDDVLVDKVMVAVVEASLVGKGFKG